MPEQIGKAPNILETATLAVKRDGQYTGRFGAAEIPSVITPVIESLLNPRGDSDVKLPELKVNKIKDGDAEVQMGPVKIKIGNKNPDGTGGLEIKGNLPWILIAPIAKAFGASSEDIEQAKKDAKNINGVATQFFRDHFASKGIVFEGMGWGFSKDNQLVVSLKGKSAEVTPPLPKPIEKPQVVQPVAVTEPIRQPEPTMAAVSASVPEQKSVSSPISIALPEKPMAAKSEPAKPVEKTEESEVDKELKKQEQIRRQQWQDIQNKLPTLRDTISTSMDRAKLGTISPSDRIKLAEALEEQKGLIIEAQGLLELESDEFVQRQIKSEQLREKLGEAHVAKDAKGVAEGRRALTDLIFDYSEEIDKLAQKYPGLETPEKRAEILERLRGQIERAEKEPVHSERWVVGWYAEAMRTVDERAKPFRRKMVEEQLEAKKEEEKKNKNALGQMLRSEGYGL